MSRSIRHTAETWVSNRKHRGELAPGSADAYRLVLRQFAAMMEKRRLTLEGVKRRHIEEFLSTSAWKSKRGVAASTTSYRLTILKMFFQGCVDAGYLKVDPTVGIKPPRRSKPVPRNVTAETVAKVLANAEPRVQAMILLAVQLGLRRGEISRLEVGDLDLVARRVLVRGKGRKERILPLTDEAVETIRTHLAERGRHAGPLFPSQMTGGHLTPGRISVLFRDACEGLDEQITPTSCGTRRPPTCSPRALTCARCRPCSDTSPYRRPPGTSPSRRTVWRRPWKGGATGGQRFRCPGSEEVRAMRAMVDEVRAAAPRVPITADCRVSPTRPLGKCQSSPFPGRRPGQGCPGPPLRSFPPSLRPGGRTLALSVMR